MGIVGILIQLSNCPDLMIVLARADLSIGLHIVNMQLITSIDSQRPLHDFDSAFERVIV